MDRRTPPSHNWAKLLRASFEGASSPDGLTARPGTSPEPAEAVMEVDDLLAKAVADVERHAVSATATRARVLALRADAGAALQAAAILEAGSGPGARSRAVGERTPGATLDVRR